MPPKGGSKRKQLASTTTTTTADGSLAPHIPTLAEQLSYLDAPRPFKNPNYTKNVNRRTKALKTVLTQEREREKAERERRRLAKLEREGMKERGEGEDKMDVDGAPASVGDEDEEEMPSYTSVEAPPSVLPQKHYCDITGLEALYTDPATGLRYHDKSVYDIIKGLTVSAAKEYLVARGVNPVVK